MTHTVFSDITIRAPREDELESIHEMLNACDLVDCGMPDSPLDQLSSEWRDANMRLETDAWVAVTPQKRIVGYAAIGQHNNYVRNRFYGRVHPDYRGQGIGSALLALVEKRAREFAPLARDGVRVVLQTWCHDGNRSGKQLLEEAGFTCNRQTWAMAIDLPDAPSQPAWPQGIALRPFVPERDGRVVFDAAEEAFEDHWGHIPGNFEGWYQRHIVNREGFDPALWFIAVDGEQIAGVALCGYYLDAGLVDTLGVRRPWRRSGLGMALLRHSFGEFYRRGTRKVTLGVDSQSLTGATRLYERAGMSVELAYADYEKELRAGVDLSTQTLQA